MLVSVRQLGSIVSYGAVLLVEELLTNVFFSCPQSLSLLPEEAIVGLITYGKMVHVHEVRSTCLWSLCDLLIVQSSRCLSFSSTDSSASFARSTTALPPYYLPTYLPTSETLCAVMCIHMDMSDDSWPSPTSRSRTACAATRTTRQRRCPSSWV